MEMGAKQLTLFKPSDFLSKTEVKEMSWQKFLIWFLLGVAIFASSPFITMKIISSDDYPYSAGSMPHLIVVLVGAGIPMAIFIVIMLLIATKARKESEARELEEKGGYPLITQ